MLRLHAYPAFGSMGSCGQSHLQAWVKKPSSTLAPSTVAVAHGVVASIFKSAIRDRRIVASPCVGTRLPEEAPADRPARDRPGPRDRGSAAAALPRARHGRGRHGPPAGARPSGSRSTLGPATAVGPPDPARGAPAGVAQCRPPYLGPPKRRASKRNIPLPRVAVEALVSHLADFPPSLGPILWRDTAGLTATEDVELVFSTEAGNPIRRNRFSDVWRRAVAEAGTPPDTTFHDIRHFYASLLIRHGESVKVVQARLSTPCSALLRTRCGLTRRDLAFPQVRGGLSGESAGKPDSVPPGGGGDHLSGAGVAAGLVRPTWCLAGHLGGYAPSHLLGLAPDGVYLAADVTAGAGGLLPHPFTLTGTRETRAPGGLLSVALSTRRRAWGLPSVLPCGVRTFLDATRRGRLADSPPPDRTQASISGRNAPLQAEQVRDRRSRVRRWSLVTMEGAQP